MAAPVTGGPPGCRQAAAVWIQRPAAARSARRRGALHASGFGKGDGLGFGVHRGGHAEGQDAARGGVADVEVGEDGQGRVVDDLAQDDRNSSGRSNPVPDGPPQMITFRLCRGRRRTSSATARSRICGPLSRCSLPTKRTTFACSGMPSSRRLRSVARSLPGPYMCTSTPGGMTSMREASAS